MSNLVRMIMTKMRLLIMKCSTQKGLHLPNLLAIVPPLKPPSIPPMANMLTAIEYRVFRKGFDISSLFLRLYTSFMKFSMFCKTSSYIYCTHNGDLKFLLVPKIGRLIIAMY